MKRKLDKKILILFAGRLVQAGLAIFTIRLMTGLLPVKEVGNQYVINSIILWFSLVLINPLGMYINRHINDWRSEKKLKSYLRQINIFFITIAAISLPVLVLIKFSNSMATDIDALSLIIFIFIFIYFSTWFQTLVSFFNFFHMTGRFVFLNILAQISGLLFAYVNVHHFGDTAICWLVGLLEGQVVGLLLAVVWFYYFLNNENGNEEVDKAQRIFSKATFKFCFPVAVTTLFMWFLNQGYRLYVEKNMGLEVLASVGVGLGVAASVAGVIESITTQYLHPSFYASLTNSTFEQRKASWFLLWSRALSVYIPFSFLTLASSYFLVKVLISKLFEGAVTFLMAGSFIELFRQLSNIIYLVSHAEKKTEKNIFPYFSGAVCLLTSLLILKYFNILIPKTLVMALLLSAVVTFSINLWSIKKIFSHNVGLNNIIKVVLYSIPIPITLIWAHEQTPLWMLFCLASLSGIWCLLVVFKQFYQSPK